METGQTKIGFVSLELAHSHGFDFDEGGLEKNPQAFEVAFVSENLDVDFEKAISAGAVEVVRPVKKPWGQTISYVRDCNGVLVEIASPMG